MEFSNSERAGEATAEIREAERTPEVAPGGQEPRKPETTVSRKGSAPGGRHSACIPGARKKEHGYQ